MKRYLTLLSLLVPAPAFANYCAAPLTRPNATISGVVNTYYPIVSNLTSGNTIQIGAPRGAAEDLRVGDLLLVWIPQTMQFTGAANSANAPYGGNAISGNEVGRGWTSLNHSGKFQWMRVAGLGGASGAANSLVKAASDGGATTVTVTNGGGQGLFGQFELAKDGVRSAQAIRVPQYGNVTVSGTVTAAPYWHSVSIGSSGPQSTGGIVAIDAAGTVTFAPGARIDVAAMGFRGGAAEALTGSSGTSPALDLITRWYAHSADPAISVRLFGGLKGEGGAGTPRKVYDSRTGTIHGPLIYSGSPSNVSSDGYGATAGASGRGAPGNAGGGATDQCPFSTNGPSSTYRTMCRTGTVSYAGNRLNTGGGGGGGHGNGGKGGEQDFDGTRNGGNTTSDNVTPSYAGPIGYGGGGIGGKGVAFGLFESYSPNPAGNHQFAMLGGGGGAGSTNDTINGKNASGGNGGGVILIRAGKLAGSGALIADGGDAPDVTTADGGGGGGGGGWILVAARENSSPALSFSARGGAGGDAGDPNGWGMGAGGGGGGGYVGTSTTLPAPPLSAVQGGAAGRTQGAKPPRSSSMEAEGLYDSLPPSAAEAGSAGGVGQFPASGLGVPAPNAPPASLASSTSSVAPGSECVPIVSQAFSVDGGNSWQSSITVARDTVFKMRVTIENANQDSFFSGSRLPQLYEDIAFTHTYPAGIVNASPPNAASTCAATLEAHAGGGTLGVPASGSIDGQSNCVITVDLRAAAAGTYTSRIAAETVSVRQLKQVTGATPVLLRNHEESSASVTVPASVTAVKTSMIVSDPINGAASAKRIPGSLVDYSLSIANPAVDALDQDTMAVIDSIPSEVKLFVEDLSQGSPYEFAANDSGLSCVYGGGLGASDCVEFSIDGADWSYVPVPDADGADAAVRFVRFRPLGSMAGDSGFGIRYRVVVK